MGKTENSPRMILNNSAFSEPKRELWYETQDRQNALTGRTGKNQKAARHGIANAVSCVQKSQTCEAVRGTARKEF